MTVHTFNHNKINLQHMNGLSMNETTYALFLK